MHNRKLQITNIADTSAPDTAARPNPEVVPMASRRSFSMAEKRRIVAAADACVAPGDIGALLRREGIYSSHLATWRKQRNAAEETLLAGRKRGPKVQPGSADAKLIAQLTRENERLRQKLVQADLIIDVQKKLATLLGMTTTDTPSDPKS